MVKIFPEFSKSLSAETNGQIWRRLPGAKMVRTCSIWLQSFVAIRRHNTVGEGTVRSFLSCVFVTLRPDGMKCTHSKSYNFAIYSYILMQFSAFLEDETVFAVVCKLRKNVATR